MAVDNVAYRRGMGVDLSEGGLQANHKRTSLIPEGDHTSTLAGDALVGKRQQAAAGKARLQEESECADPGTEKEADTQVPGLLHSRDSDWTGRAGSLFSQLVCWPYIIVLTGETNLEDAG